MTAPKHLLLFVAFTFLGNIQSALLFSAAINTVCELKNTKSIREAFLKDYGTPIQDMRKAEHGVENEVYIIKTKKGFFVLRVYKGQNFDKILDEVKLQKILRESDHLQSHIPRMIAGKSGSYIHKADNKFYVVFEFIPGSHPTSFDKELVARILNILYYVHQITFSKKSLFKHRKVTTVIDGVKLFMEEALKNSIMTKEEHASLKRVVFNFKKALVLQPPYKTVIHFDVHSKNIITHGEKVFLIDFDDFLVSSPLLELAVLIRGTCFDSKGRFNVDLAQYISKSYPFYQVVGETLSMRFLYDALLFDLIRVIAANVKKEKNDKRAVFLKYYQRILLIASLSNIARYKKFIKKVSP